jgi:soluble lytic murein transglycosylase
MELLDRVGQSRGAALVARSAVGQHLRGGITARNRKVWEALYPLRFRKLVEKSAARAKVDPDLLQALMREESRFNRHARSSTGAIGLAQLMPKTAREVARKLKLGPVTEGALADPALNIRLGGAYLGSLLSELGSVAHAVAAYNAGTQRVREWASARSDLDLDAWTEEIPFAETRTYVMRVLGSYGAYRLVYGRGAPVPWAAPESVAKRATLRSAPLPE